MDIKTSQIFLYLDIKMYSITLRQWIDFKIPPTEIIPCAMDTGNDDILSDIPIGISPKLSNYIAENKKFSIFDTDQTTNKKLCISSFYPRSDFRRSFSHINRRKIKRTVDEKIFIDKKWSEIDNYVKDLTEYKFVISPEGNCIDCHRHYEAFLCKCIPIIEKNPRIEKKYKNLPILWTYDYSELTEEYLNEKYEEFLEKKFDFISLFLSYWEKNSNIIRNIKSNHNLKKDWFEELARFNGIENTYRNIENKKSTLIKYRSVFIKKILIDAITDISTAFLLGIIFLIPLFMFVVIILHLKQKYW